MAIVSAPEPRSMLARARLPSVGLWLVMALFAAASLHGVANYWQWGHDGYNGAAFSQAARNSIRFGIVGQAQYHTGLDAPPPEAIYTHHPLALHFHLIAVQLLLGADEWVGRLVPALYSIAGLWMLYLLVARFRDRTTALAAAALYALTPLHSIFATMIDHEQGAIFWLLTFWYGYFTWLERPSRSALVGSMVAMTMAVQFDWPAYYVAFFVAVHCLNRVLEARSVSGTLRNRFARFLAVFTAVVLVNFVGFFVWIYLARGTLTEMTAAYAGRAGGQTDALAVQLQRLWDLQGPLLVALFAIWAVMAARRARDGVAMPLDAIVSAFVFAQGIHWVAFPAAAANHSYWTYYLGPALAIAGGLVLVEALRRARRASRPVAVLAAIAVACLLVGQATFAWHELRWARQNGHATYHDDYDDQFAEVAWAREVAVLFPRPRSAFVVDPSVQRRRIELDYYLDGPIDTDLRAPVSPELASRIAHRVLLLDMEHFDLDSEYGRYVSHLAETRRTFIWDRRFLAIDLSTAGHEVSAFASREEPPSLLHRWLVNPDRPPIRWVRDDELSSAGAL